MGKRNKLLKGGLSRKNHLAVMKSKKPSQPVNMSIDEDSIESIKEKQVASKPKALRHRRNVDNTVLSKGQKRRLLKKDKFKRRLN
jgi:hypothetical protein